jgi:hypothetical protein
MDRIQWGLKNGKITAWRDKALTIPLPESKFDSLMLLESVTEDVEDPVTGEIARKVRHREFDHTSCVLKILEQWKFDIASGKTEVQIIAVAPVASIWNDKTNKFTAKAMFWMKYTELQELFAQHAAQHLQNSFPMHAWKSMFCEQCDLHQLYE